MSTDLARRFAKRLSAELIGRGAICDAELTPFCQRAVEEGRCLADLLVAEGAAERGVVLDAASRALGLSAVSLTETGADVAILDILPARVAHRLKVIPLFVVENEATFAMADPFDLEKVKELGFRIAKSVIPVFALASDIDKFLDLHYGSLEVEEVSAGPIEYEQESDAADEENPAERYEEGSDGDKPIVRLVDLILRIALEDEATDVHVEPRGGAVVVRNRIDGLLKEKPSKIPANASRAILSRIKVLAGLDITERSVPQDGRIALRFENRNIDVRVSTFPTIHGEKVVLRILDRDRRLLDLRNLGLSNADLECWEDLLKLRDGIILVTGPTGCGKTSTLYASLSHIKSPELNIVTLEDPVEYEDADFAQAQVNNARGFTFAGGLRSILRQDPDVILVGEIRDFETAQIAVQAALTGHLVLATLHTNDAASAVTRLTDIGLAPYLIAATLRGVLAQRLVRRLCPHCGHRHESAAARFGCFECDFSGYKGRIGIYELLAVDSELKEAIADGTREFDEAVARMSHHSLRDDGMLKVENGVTDLAELKRIVPEAFMRSQGHEPHRHPDSRSVGNLNGIRVDSESTMGDIVNERMIRLLAANDLCSPM